MKTRLVSLMVEPEFRQRLRRAAFEAEVTVSEILRRAAAAYLEHVEPRKRKEAD